jgi:hypothetical protein
MVPMDDGYYKVQRNDGVKGSLETFINSKGDGSFAIGWLKNTDYDALHVMPCNSTPLNAIHSNEKLRIDFLKPQEDYTLDLYSIQDSGPVSYILSINESSNIFGTLKKPIFPTINLTENLAFRLSLNSSHGMLSYGRDTVGCAGDTIYVTAVYGEEQGSYQFKWDFGNNVTSTLSNPKVYYEVAGSYHVTLVITDSASGTADSLKQLIDVLDCSPARISLQVDAGSGSPVEIYPNPATETVEVKSINGFSEAKICDLTGRVLLSALNKAENTQLSIDISSLAMGVYLVVVREGSKEITNKLVVR